MLKEIKDAGAVWKRSLERVGLSGFCLLSVTSLLLVVTAVWLFLSGTSYGSWVTGFDLSSCTGYKIKASLGLYRFFGIDKWKHLCSLDMFLCRPGFRNTGVYVMVPAFKL